MDAKSLSWFSLIMWLGVIPAGCTNTRLAGGAAPVAPVPFSHFHFAASHGPILQRVLALPLLNETHEPRVAREIRDVLASELQQTGMYEVVVAPFDAPPDWSRRVRLGGRFDEQELVDLAEAFHADVVLCGSITHYQPYAPPRIGLSLRMISTSESIVIASVDAVWDARDQAVANEARAYFDHIITKGSATLSSDVVLASPRLFQKYVCSQSAKALSGLGPVSAPSVAVQAAAVQTPPQDAAPVAQPLEPESSDSPLQPERN